ncbi:MAG: chorismate mutase [Hydrogenophilales bacterium 17-61-76]|nr:MAG: chorismate mutase [Hydrogenophilales bacterium 17-61-76]
MNDLPEDLSALRARIDGIDDAILKLLSERAGIAQQVGRAKKGEIIYRPEREAQIVQRLRAANPGPLSGDTVERLIREIMSACRALEQTTRVAYLGPAGTFTQLMRTGTAANPAGLDGIQRVYGHAQSLAQCQQWLARHLPQAERVSVVSNSDGARRAAAEPDAATLGSEAAAELYGLAVVAARIEDEASNTTRFLVLGNTDAAPSGRDKTSLVVGIHNQPGAIVKLLQPLAEAGISMSKLESRPARSSNWEYLFFIVCESHRQDPRLAAVLAEIEARAAFLKILGSYPAALS